MPPSPRLVINPDMLDFGQVTVGTPVTLNVLISNNAEEFGPDITIVSVTGPGAPFSSDFIAGEVVPAGNIPILHVVTFNPAGVGVVSATITLDHTGINGPSTIDITGEGIAAGAKAISISPSSWDFGSQKVLTPSAEKVFTITSTGTVAVSITGITFNGDFSAGPTFPGGFPVALAPGATLDFGVIFTPTVTGLDMDPAGAVVASDAPTNPNNVSLQGTGYLILPAFTISGTTIALLLGFRGAAANPPFNPASFVSQADPDDFDCEVQSILVKRLDCGIVGIEKYFGRVLLRVESQGNVPADVRAEFNSPRGNTIPPNISMGGVGANITVDDFVDAQLSADIIDFVLTVNQGPLVIAQMQVEYEPRGEYVEGT